MPGQKSELPDNVVFFDPEGSNTAPNLTAVEILLGGVGRLMFPDGTQQFADAEVQPVLIYSPRLQPAALEQFCGEHMAQYERFHTEHIEQLAEFESVAMTAFW